MLKKKDWKEMIQEFSDKVDKREKLIRGKIDELKEQEEIIQTKIKDNSGRMIELEMEGDTSGVTTIKKENRDMRIELEEVQDAIEGYKSQLGTARDYYAKDLEKIRAAVNKAEEEHFQWKQDTRSRRDGLEAKIEDLKKQVEQINNEIVFTRTISEEMEWGYITRIDPRVDSLKDYEKQNFIKSWMSGHDTERFFKKD
ncbi:hypothetical protein P9847_01345 [Paenibacillus chibensis]|uniref:Uncharacterized protein n=1 Tax=Paenibacillus chibensis TaxID=59846 RepID=A0ABU6PM51_9BACL|nr:hypothetical protein [Paenibacillus chibensis]